MITSSTRALRLSRTLAAFRTGSPQASPLHHRSRAPAPRATSIALLQAGQGHSRSYSQKSTDDDDLGGPGGQEPVDPTARARQNARLRNRTIAGMVLLGVPLFYLLASPGQVAAAQTKADEVVGAGAGGSRRR